MIQLINFEVLYFMLFLDYFEFKSLNKKGQVNFTLITNEWTNFPAMLNLDKNLFNSSKMYTCTGNDP